MYSWAVAGDAERLALAFNDAVPFWLFLRGESSNSSSVSVSGVVVSKSAMRLFLKADLASESLRGERDSVSGREVAF